MCINTLHKGDSDDDDDDNNNNNRSLVSHKISFKYVYFKKKFSEYF
jgi:hypothetical protein